MYSEFKFHLCQKRLGRLGPYAWPLKCPEAWLRHTRQGRFRASALRRPQEMEVVFLEADGIVRAVQNEADVGLIPFAGRWTLREMM